MPIFWFCRATTQIAAETVIYSERPVICQDETACQNIKLNNVISILIFALYIQCDPYYTSWLCIILICYEYVRARAAHHSTKKMGYSGKYCTKITDVKNIIKYLKIFFFFHS